VEQRRAEYAEDRELYQDFRRRHGAADAGRRADELAEKREAQAAERPAPRFDPARCITCGRPFVAGLAACGCTVVYAA